MALLLCSASSKLFIHVCKLFIVVLVIIPSSPNSCDKADLNFIFFSPVIQIQFMEMLAWLAGVCSGVCSVLSAEDAHPDTQPGKDIQM
jgi:hypothetical protein